MYIVHFGQLRKGSDSSTSMNSAYMYGSKIKCNLIIKYDSNVCIRTTPSKLKHLHNVQSYFQRHLAGKMLHQLKANLSIPTLLYAIIEGSLQ